MIPPLPDRIDVIFLDMDGVLCDFHTAVASLWGLDPTGLDQAAWAEIGEWGIGIPKPGFWDRIEAEGAGWWERLGKLPWADDLWDACRQRARRIAILTSPAPFYACHQGKRAWVRAQLGDADVVITSAKALCSGPGRVLIDDRTKYAESWEAAGGRFLGLRRPWTRPTEAASGGGAQAAEIIELLRG